MLRRDSGIQMKITNNSEMRASMIKLIRPLSVEYQTRMILNGLRRVKRLPVERRLKESYFRTNEVTKLQLGGGAHLLPGWLNSDYYPTASSLFLDATKRFPFEDNVFDYVFSEHMIEHIGFNEGCNMLSETHRVLKPNGHPEAFHA